MSAEAIASHVTVSGPSMFSTASQREPHHLVCGAQIVQAPCRRGVVLSVGVVITVGHAVRLPGTSGPSGRTRPPVPDAHSSTGGSALMKHARPAVPMTPIGELA